MAELENLFEKTLEGIKNMLNSDTVIGNPIETTDGTTVIPFSRVTVGYGIGGIDGGKTDVKTDSMYGGSGGGLTMQPLGFLVITNGVANVIKIDDSTTAEKVLNLVPDMFDTITQFFNK